MDLLLNSFPHVAALPFYQKLLVTNSYICKLFLISPTLSSYGVVMTPLISSYCWIRCRIPYLENFSRNGLIFRTANVTICRYLCEQDPASDSKKAVSRQSKIKQSCRFQVKKVGKISAEHFERKPPTASCFNFAPISVYTSSRGAVFFLYFITVIIFLLFIYSFELSYGLYQHQTQGTSKLRKLWIFWLTWKRNPQQF